MSVQESFPPSSAPSAWTFHILTFGCKVNQYESQALREAWQRLGGIETSDPAQAQVALVNSCAVTARGERDARNALYRLQRAAPAARRILTGCSACLAAKGLDRPCVHVVIPPKSKAVLMQGPWQWPAAREDAPHILPEENHVPPFGQDGFHIRAFHRARPVLKVQDGCSHRCTYCIVPLMRGSSVSRPPQDILAEAQHLLEAGHGEIMVSGINLHQYGRDTAWQTPQDFWELLRYLDAQLAPQWAGRARLRISSLEPTQLDARGLETLASCRLLCPHVHLSLQNGSPAILRRMGRGHCRLPRLLRSVAELHTLWPHMGLGADILMGFPGEREEDVQATLDMVRELNLSYAHVFPYSVRPGTPAAHFAGQVPHAEKLDRAARVRARIAEQKEAFLHQLAHMEELVVVLDKAGDESMVEDSAEECWRGIDAHYAPCRINVAAGQEHAPEGLVRVAPLGVKQGSLVVAPLHGASRRT